MRLIVTALLLALLQHVPHPQSAGKDVKTYPQSNITPAQPKAVEYPTGSNSNKNEGETQKYRYTNPSISVDKLPPVSVHKDWSDYIYVTLNGLLVLVTGATFGAVMYQAILTRKAAEAAQASARATEKYVLLQETQLAQWVDFEDVKISNSGFNHDSTSVNLTVKFRITNPTKMTLTLTKIAVDFFTEKGTDVDIRESLTPDNGYHVERTCRVDGSAFQQLRRNNLLVPIIVWVGYEDAFGNFQEMTDASYCKPITSEFTNYDGVIRNKWKLPEKRDDA